MKLLITGCGRSGTAFIAKILRIVDLEATHEVLFNPVRCSWPHEHIGIESSWLAVPHLHKLPLDVVVFHQLRNPFDVIRSLMGYDFFNRPESKAYRNFVYEHEPSIKKLTTDIDRCIAYWILWNTRVQKRAEFTYQLEELTPSRLRDFLSHAGTDVSLAALVSAFTQTGKMYNHRPRANCTAEQILGRPMGPRLERVAKSFGYKRLK
jgi:hypothetical protein